jgi:hypothetical protein
MSWNSILGLVALISLALPVVLMVVLRLAAYRTFPALLISILFAFTYNLLSLGYVNVSAGVINNLNFWNNMLDAPLMLLFITYLSFTPEFAKKIRVGILVYIVFEIAVIAIAGYNTRAMTIILGPGLAAVFSLCLWCFIRHTKFTILHRKASGRAIISAALLFAYGCYFLIYLMYYVLRTEYVADTYLIYFLSVILSSLLLSAGILAERKRVQKLNELMITRKELSSLYNEQVQRTPFKAVVLPFDKDHWN